MANKTQKKKLSIAFPWKIGSQLSVATFWIFISLKKLLKIFFEEIINGKLYFCVEKVETALIYVQSWWLLHNQSQQWKTRTRGGSRAVATSKMEDFVITVNGFEPLTIITKGSILNVAAVLDPPLRTMCEIFL